jgi:hypothetical protein
VLWAIFSSDREHASLEWQEEIDSYVTSIEKLLGRKLEPGRNGDVKSMRLTLDPVVMLHRPLVWYGVSFVYRRSVGRRQVFIFSPGCRSCGYIYSIVLIPLRIQALCHA